jgi:geranylgeranyl reductase family protein
MIYDVAIVGAGPAGSTCAAMCAQAGLSTLLVERAIFPREKVCGDCLNPACWPVLDRLKLSGRVLALPHARLAELEFIGVGGRSLRFPLHAVPRGEIAIKRSVFDQLLRDRAQELGAEVREDCAVTAVQRGWRVQTNRDAFSARILVAADGRNSTVARLLGLLPASERDRIGVQTHFAAPADFGERVVMRFLPQGYCGLASVGGGEVNLCLVSTGDRIGELKSWAGAHFALPPVQEWRTITPLTRAAVPPAHEGLLLVGDAARVIEPFTGEGIYYALASGELAARHIVAGDLPGYAAAHAELYRGRLWINELSKQAALHPRLATAVLELARFHPGMLRFLTAKVVGATALNAVGAPKVLAQK